MKIDTGQVLASKYRVERVLGQGGMGAIVSAVHVQLGTRVALKFLLPKLAADPALVARFEREAKATVLLKSEHTPRVFDVGVLESGAPYIVMELLEGEDLESRCHRSGPLPPWEAVDFVLQAAEAIAEAHALGIVHRDLKPANLFLTTRVDGRPLVKVLDFGISKMSLSPGDRRLTATGEILGTPYYMSPEQLLGSSAVDARTDIWAVGAILYTLLAGHPPFDGDSMAQLCTRVMYEQPRPLTALRADVPPALSGIVMRCLEKKPEQRFPSIADVARALEPFGQAREMPRAEKIRAILGRAASSPPPEPNAPRGRVTARAFATTAPAEDRRKGSQRSAALALGAALLVGVAGATVYFAPGAPEPVRATPGAPSSEAAEMGSALPDVVGASPATVDTGGDAGVEIETIFVEQLAVSSAGGGSPASPSKERRKRAPVKGTRPSTDGVDEAPPDHRQ